MTAPIRQRLAAGNPSLRRSLLLFVLGALVYVAAVGLVLVARIGPAAVALQRESNNAIAEFRESQTRLTGLDSTLQAVTALLASAKQGPVAARTLAEHRERLERMEEGARTLERLASASGPRTELQRTLALGVDNETNLRSSLLASLAALELHDLGAAERLLGFAIRQDVRARAMLTEATSIALRDVNDQQLALVATTTMSVRIVGAWFLTGALLFPVIVLYLRRRLDAPLTALDSGLARVAAGDFSTTIPITATDEIGRLTEHFNRVTEVLRERASQEAERAQLESAARTRAILDAALDAVVVIDDTGAIREWSPQAEVTFGWSRVEVLGKSIADVIIPEESRADHDRGLRRYGDGGATPMLGRRIETTALRRDGTRFPVELAITPLHRAGHTEFSAFIRDVTEQRRMESELRQAQKMDAVGQLAGGIAHDFNNLLTGIIGYADLMRNDESLCVQGREDAAAIFATAERGAELARGLLTMARRSHGKRESVDMDKVTQEVVDLFSRTVDRRITVEVALDAHAAVARGDRSQLSNAILNLALNARDAMPDGGTLRIATSMRQLDEAFCAAHSGDAKAGEYFAIVVSDTGVGMTADVRSRIFEPFFTTKSAGEGTGLGLAMVYGTVRAHRGIVTVGSEPGRGTSFVLYVPVDRSDREDDSGPAREVRSGRGRILLVDDEDGVRRVAARLLQQMGYTVEAARDGQEAVELIQADPNRCDLVLLDGNMPRMTGRDAATAIRKIRPELPLVLATGYFEAHVDSASTFGIFNGAIAKPYDLATLSKAVAAHLKHIG